jgi:hypothetical protein
VIGHIGGEVSARRGRGDKQHGGAGRHGPASAPRRAQRFRAERGACWGDGETEESCFAQPASRLRGVLGLLVTEWSRLFRLRPAPGQHGAVLTVGSSDFVDSTQPADIDGSALAATAGRHRLRSITDLRFRDFIQVEPDGRNPGG